MLSISKKDKLLAALKSYHKKYMDGKITELDESGTRLMINTFLSDVLCFLPIEEIKTEYMIKGTYADYVVQTKGVRHFLVEVKALSLNLSDKHLRQAINYGANEGIEWVLLTNGKHFNLYKIIFGKPIDSQIVFSIDLSNASMLKNNTDHLQFLHKDSINNNGLIAMWNRTLALDTKNVAGMLYAQPVLNYLKKELKTKFKRNFNDDEIKLSLDQLVTKSIDLSTVKKSILIKKKKKVEKAMLEISSPENISLQENIENTNEEIISQ